MTAADWLIVAVVLLSIISAAVQGFFAEGLSMAGLVVGYLVAAWKYPGLSDWFMTFLKNAWLADIFSFLIIFFVILLLFQRGGSGGTQVDEGRGAERVRPFYGSVAGRGEGVFDSDRGADGNDRVHTYLVHVEGRSVLAPYFLGGGKSCDVGGAGGVAGAVQ